MKRRMIILSGIVLVFLLVPAIAMQFTDEVDWTLGDFVVAGGMLFVTGLLCDLVLRATHNTKVRIVAIAALLIALVLVWAELSVGLLERFFDS